MGNRYFRFLLILVFTSPSVCLWGQLTEVGGEAGKGEKFSIVIHGGAGSSAANASPAQVKKRKASLKKALDRGVGILSSGGTALDAVESVLRILEDDPQFNAGKGAVFNAAGDHELDASIMDGRTKACGAVAGVKIVKNPISLARLVMSETRHVLLAGPGAEEFAKGQGVELVPTDYFDTIGAKKSWERYKLKMFKLKMSGLSKSRDEKVESSWKMGTVGCVALDRQGDLAAGTTTGGMTYKKFGRIGDSPIVGAGTYADNATCGVSATGIGEQYIRNAVAYDVSAQMKYKGVTLQAAVDDNLRRRLNKNDGGLIAIDKDGNIAMGFNTAGMARAAADSEGRYEVIWGDAVGNRRQ
ncbi:MAG: isoaspartyl peptidase/L-asparaginase family protein [Pirellulales bacterium]|jgi:beta-aspartyl-peptidase (threonine type)